MPYAFVQDVASSWEQYEHFAAALVEPAPDGLILHVAGPTDEGFRIIDVWESEEAWQDFSDQVGDPELLENVDGNPLPASLHIHLRPELLNYASMTEAAKQLQQFTEVEDVRYGGEWVRRLDDVSRFGPENRDGSAQRDPERHGDDDRR